MSNSKTLSPRKDIILIVEDEVTSDLYLTEILKDHFEVILHAKDGIEAIEKCKKHPEIAVILMDLKMPRLDGLSATREIRKFNSDVIIIAQTAYAMLGDRREAIDAGCDDYITKPIMEEKMIRLINQNMDKT
jgi:CheY-like chemotaxis protein